MKSAVFSLLAGTCGLGQYLILEQRDVSEMWRAGRRTSNFTSPCASSLNPELVFQFRKTPMWSALIVRQQKGSEPLSQAHEHTWEAM